jgi:DNA-binding CsgD family transcriptional regulator
MTHGEPEAGALEVIAWDKEVDAAWGTFAIVALLTVERWGEARERIDFERATFWGAEAVQMRANYDTVLTRIEGDLVLAEQRAHQAITSQHEGGYRPQLVHGLEALAGIAGAQESYVECARLAGAAQRLRDDLGYVLRWPFEERLRERDFEAARSALGDETFDAAFADGLALDEDAAVAYAQRARGERKRPTVGWLSLTPTETEIAHLVAAGLTNKQIGEQLLMGAETVKTHLSHVYDKVGIRSRAALATELAARSKAH